MQKIKAKGQSVRKIG